MYLPKILRIFGACQSACGGLAQRPVVCQQTIGGLGEVSAYPLSIQNDRTLPENYTGIALVWDIDKTYLSTRFSSWLGLARVPVEFAVDKQAIPGMPEVLRGLRRGPGKEVACVPLYFISASPPFLRSVIEKKMLQDGVEQDGITFKDWWRTLLELRPGRLFEQLGFKMAALLAGRLSRIRSREYLFGDDFEFDAEAFSLYSRWLRGKMKVEEMDRTLAEGGVPKNDRGNLLALADKIPPHCGKVERSYIHLEKNTPPAAFKKYGPRLTPVKGAYQLALALFQECLVDVETVAESLAAVVRVPRYRFGKIEELTQDAVTRNLIDKEKLKRLDMA